MKFNMIIVLPFGGNLFLPVTNWNTHLMDFLGPDNRTILLNQATWLQIFDTLKHSELRLKKNKLP